MTTNFYEEEEAARAAERAARPAFKPVTGKPSEVGMILMLQGYEPDQIAMRIKAARFDPATEFVQTTF